MTDWIEWKWTPEKPYPETLDTEVFVRLDKFGLGASPLPDLVENWFWGPDEVITHYRIASENKE